MITNTKAINDAGVVIGKGLYFAEELGLTKGFAWTADGRIVDLGNVLLPAAINASGLIVGSNVPFTPTVGAFWLDGGPGTDTRSGRPSNGGDQSMELVGGTFERDRCSLAYLYMYRAVLGMLSEG